MGCKYLTEGVKGAARRATSCAEGSMPIAGRARNGGHNRKKGAKLEARLRDWSAIDHTKTRHQMHRPGSFQ